MDGSDYEPCSLRNIVSSLDRKLRRAKYPYSIFRETGHAFQLTRDALKAKQKSLKKMGKGNRPNCASPITDEEIDILYEKNILGDDNPAALLNTMWFNNTIHFGLRGVKENYNLRWGDVTLHKASNGTNYLELNERQTKTRTGEHISDIRIVRPKMFATPSHAARDPVRLYQVYASKRPASYRDPQDPFYIAPRTVPVSSLHDQWFMISPVGEKKHSVLMKSMAIQGELDLSKRLTHHSAKKHLVQKLRDAGVAPTTIMQVSGHRNVQSVLNYSEMSETEQINCSNILSSSIPVRARLVSETSGPAKSVLATESVPMTPSSTETSSVVIQPEQFSATQSEKHSVSDGKSELLQSMFAGATVHIQNFNLHMK